MAKAYSAETKAAVIAAVLAGTTARQAAEIYGPSQPTIERWMSQYQRDPSMLDSLKKTETQDIGTLVQLYATAILKNLIAQAEITSDPDYILGQDADKLAILHGVLADKGTAILDRLARIAERQRERAIEGHVTG